jgi:biotin carboxyl carrier protein
MPGKILELLSSEGDEVELGDPVAILEAMKMENELKAPCAGTIQSISVTTGASVEKNQILLEIEPRG